MMTAEKIMTKNVFTVRRDASAMEAINLLVEHRINGLPVLDKDSKLCGIISERDLLLVMVEAQLRGTIDSYMSEDVITFKPESSLVEIADFFLAHRSGRVPIVNNEGRLVGVVSRGDVLKTIVKMRGID